MEKITFSKSNVYTRLTAESQNFMYDIVISNETGAVVFQVNSKNVEKFDNNMLTRELMFAWHIMQHHLIAFAQMPVAEVRSQAYADKFHMLREMIRKVNAGEYNRS